MIGPGLIKNIIAAMSTIEPNREDLLQYIEQELAGEHPDMTVQALPFIISLIPISESDEEDLVDNPEVYAVNYELDAPNLRSTASRIIKKLFKLFPDANLLMQALVFAGTLDEETKIWISRVMWKLLGPDAIIQECFRCLTPETSPKIAATIIRTIADIVPKMEDISALTIQHVQYMLVLYHSSRYELLHSLCLEATVSICRAIDDYQAFQYINYQELLSSPLMIHSGTTYKVLSSITDHGTQSAMISSIANSLQLLLFVEGFAATWDDENVPPFLHELSLRVVSFVLNSIPSSDEEHADFANYFSTLCLIGQCLPYQDGLKILPVLLRIIRSVGLSSISLLLLAQTLLQFQGIVPREDLQHCLEFCVLEDEHAGEIFDAMLQEYNSDL